MDDADFKGMLNAKNFKQFTLDKLSFGMYNIYIAINLIMNPNYTEIQNLLTK